MTEQMHDLIKAYDDHKDQVGEVQAITQTYRREIANEKKLRDDVFVKTRQNQTARRIMDERIDDMARRKHLLKTCIADVFVSSAS